VSKVSGNLRSIYAMLIAVFMFSLMDTAMKLLAAHYPAMQVAALRSLSSLPLVCAYVAWRGGFRTMMRARWSLHVLRGALGIGMLALFAYGLKKLSLAEAYSVFFIAPALITAMSVFFLKESVNLARWIAIVVGLAGVLVVLRPEGGGFLTLGGLAILGSAVCYAISAIAARILARTDNTQQMMFWLMLLMALGATALAAPDWVGVDPGHLWLLCALAVSGFFGQLAITVAWGVAIDWLLWQTLPDSYTLVGAAIIIGSGLYLIRHEKTHAESEHP